MGPQCGDAPSVGYELLYRQVARAQGIFSPRTVNVQYSLEYLAENHRPWQTVQDVAGVYRRVSAGTRNQVPVSA